MLAHRHDKHAFPHLLRSRDGVAIAAAWLSNPPYEERRDDQGSHSTKRSQPSRFQPRLPPPHWPFRQPRRNLLPHAPPVIRTRIWNGKRIERREHGINSFHLRPAFVAVREVAGDLRALRGFSLAVGNQLFFSHVFHDSVPIARACRPRSTKGCSACRSFCTARKTVFFAAPEFDFRTAAISSIPQPSQCRITKAVLSECERAASAASICFRSSRLCVKRSGVGPGSCTRSNGLFSISSSRS